MTLSPPSPVGEPNNAGGEGATVLDLLPLARMPGKRHSAIGSRLILAFFFSYAATAADPARFGAPTADGRTAYWVPIGYAGYLGDGLPGGTA